MNNILDSVSALFVLLSVDVSFLLRSSRIRVFVTIENKHVTKSFDLLQSALYVGL
jgi:hypothetical protein